MENYYKITIHTLAGAAFPFTGRQTEYETLLKQFSNRKKDPNFTIVSGKGLEAHIDLQKVVLIETAHIGEISEEGVYRPNELGKQIEKAGAEARARAEQAEQGNHPV